jgi:hypothetical protein
VFEITTLSATLLHTVLFLNANGVPVTPSLMTSCPTLPPPSCPPPLSCFQSSQARLVRRKLGWTRPARSPRVDGNRRVDAGRARRC